MQGTDVWLLLGCRGLQKAMEGLRGDGPCVSVVLEVNGGVSQQGSRGAPGGGLPPIPYPASGPSNASPHVPGSGLLCKLGFCKCVATPGLGIQPLNFPPRDAHWLQVRI